MKGQTALATTGELATALGADLVGPADLAISGIETLESAGPGTLAFIRSSKYAARWPESRASAALVTRDVKVPGHDPSGRALLIVDDADLAMLELLKIAQARLAPPRPEPGVHPRAEVDRGASVSASATVGAFALVGAGAEIGEGVVVGPHSIIAEGVRVGDGTTLHARVTLLRSTTLGMGCELFP
ncbi:MAG: hypothetical protein K8E66_11060, partial [Phycisphaerales bacterium]|nr:hypothetical protein [Phycisphaerales bacterium]